MGSSVTLTFLVNLKFNFKLNFLSRLTVVSENNDLNCYVQIKCCWIKLNYSIDLKYCQGIRILDLCLFVLCRAYFGNNGLHPNVNPPLCREVGREMGGLSIEGWGKHCFSLTVCGFFSSHALFSASLSFIIFIFILTPFNTWDSYYFRLNLNLVLLIKSILYIKSM